MPSFSSLSHRASVRAGRQNLKVCRHSKKNRTSYQPYAEILEARCLPAITVSNSFAGLAEATTQGYTPPDTCGAAGTVKYVETVNQTVQVSNKDGSSPVSDTFAHLFYTTGGLPAASSGSFLSDPIVVWDDQVQRFIVGDQDVDFNTHVSTFDLAISKSASPATLTTADWYFKQIVTTENNGSTSIADADYPGNFGYNHDAFVFTLNMFAAAGSNHVQVNTVKISDLVNGTLTAFRNDLAGVFSLRPTVMHDSIAGDPLWLLTEGGNDASIKVLKMTNVLSSSASFTTSTLAVNPYLPINYPLQPDGTDVVTNIDTRIMKAAEWNGKLVASHHVGVSTNQDDARWYLLDVSSGTPRLSDQGDVTNPSTASGIANTYDYYPSVDINGAGIIGMSFMQSSHTGTNKGQFMSMYVTARAPSDAPGTMETPVLVKAGATNYSDGYQRAGDLSGISVDTDGSFWSANEYAAATGSPNWGTWIAHYFVGLEVTVSNPGNAASVAAPPSAYTLTFSAPIKPGSLSAGALSVNGIASNGVMLDPTNSVATFTFSASPVTAQGPQTMTLAAGAATSSDGTLASEAYSATFYYDVLPLAVASVNPPSGAVFQLPASSFTYDVAFNEPIDPSAVGVGNLVLSGGTVASATLQAGNETVEYTLNGVSAEGYLTVSIPAGTFKDQYDNPTSPSFTASYYVDNPTLAFPGTFLASSPLGSLVYQGNTTGTIAFASDTDTFTLNLDAGQTVTVLAAPDPGLQATITFRDPANNLLGSTTAAGAGQNALLQTLPAASTGVYTITVAGAGGTMGAYTLGVTLNAALDREAQGGPSNNSLATAQDIGASFFSLGGGASRGAVLGTTNASPSAQDFYAFTLSAGDSATLALKSLGGNPVNVTLEDAGGATVALATASASNVDRSITDFVASSSGTYYAVVSGTPGTNYSLVVTRNAEFGTGIDNSLPAAQPVLGNLAGAAHALGYIGASTTTIAFSELPPQPVNGVTLKGLTFGFQIGGVASTDATFGGAGPGTTKYTSPPQLEGNAAGVLTMTFANPTPTLSFGFALATTGTVTSACIVSLYDASSSLITTIPVTTTVPAGYTYSEALFNYAGARVKSAVLTFNSAAAPRFVMDNVTYGSGAEAEYYALTLNGGTTFQAGTTTPADGAGAFANTLDPMLRLLNAAGTQVAQDDNSAPDGRNAVLTYPVPSGQGGAYYLEVLPSAATSSPTLGEYDLTLGGLSPSEAVAPFGLPGWTANYPGYSQTISVSGASAALTFSSTGTLPPGLALTSSGVLSGTPTMPGSYAFTVMASDSIGDSGSRGYTVVINPPLAITSPPPANAAVGSPYTQTISASGGTGTLTFSSAGPLPAGLTLSSTGVLAGIPSTASGFRFTVTATDAVGASASQSYTVFVFAFSPTTLPNATVKVPGYSQTITVSGGIAPYVFTATGTLPPGMTLSSSGVVSGVPSAAGSYSFVVTATDVAGISASESYTFTIDPGPVLNKALTDVTSFDYTHGAYPEGGLIMDSSGDLFGTTYEGGTLGYGTVFEVPQGSGGIITLASFTYTNGAYPLGDLIEDGTGNLFGTASAGGSSGDGTVFELHKGSGSITILASFNNTNGNEPRGRLVEDSNGNLFGATQFGGPSNNGTVFEVAKGSGIATVLASFNNSNGANPVGGVIEDGSGNLFGTTDYGGTLGDGTVFELVQDSGTITTLANFNGTNGASPLGGLIADSNGNLFGTTETGGTGGYGTVFELPKGSGSIKTLANLDYTSGSSPEGDLVEDSSGNLFGATYGGGLSGYGNVFEILAGSGRATILASFSSSNGGDPIGGMVEDTSGALFGTTEYGGPSSYGTLFKVSSTLAGWTINQMGYSQTLLVSGGSGSLTFSQTAGTLPTGVTLSSTGVLSGTPTALGDFAFTATVTDSVGATGSQNYDIVINSPPSLVNTLPPWTVSEPYGQHVVSGGTAPYTFKQTAGALPPGLSLSADGSLIGVPTMAGSYSFTLTATDVSGSSTASQTITITINRPVIIVTTLANNWTINQPGFDQTFQAAQGTGAKTFTSTGSLPPGLTLSTSGELSGTPTSLGTYQFTLTAVDTTGSSSSRVFTMTIDGPVMFTTSASAICTANYPFIQAILATGGTGGKTFTAPSDSLPSGINVLPGGTLMGTPIFAGTYTFTITATDTTGASASQVFTMVVNPAITFASLKLANWTVNQPGYSQTLSASGGTGSLTISESGPLPAGLTLSSNPVLSGTPTAVGSYMFTITAKDTLGASSSVTYTVVINPAVSLPALTLPADTAGVSYNQTITAGGGTGALRLTVTNITGAIPGLNVPSSATGSLVITGPPTTAGMETFTLTASDALGSTSSQSYTVVVNPAVSMTTAGLASWTAAFPGYSQTFAATGGTGSLTFSTAAASLPPGLTLSAAGVLAGTPTMFGSFTFTVTATDSVGGSGSQSYTVVIHPSVTITAATLPVWTANLAGYNQTFIAAGGTGSLTFGTSGTLPPGLSLSSSGVLNGTPTATGSYTFTATASDALGASGSQSFSVTINPPVTLNPGVLAPGLVNFAYSRTITASGGTGTVSLVVSAITGAIPGLTVPASGTGALAVTGTPAATGTEQFTLTATDALGASTIVTYSITINPVTVYVTLPARGYSGTPGSTIMSFPISINQLQDQASTNHVGLQSATLAVAFPAGVFGFPLGTGKATSYVSLGSVPLSDTVAPGGAADWSLSATAPADGQLNITLSALSGKKITSDNPAMGGGLVTINFPISSSYAPDTSTATAITVVSASGTFHTSIVGTNGTYVLTPAPPYAGSVTVNPPLAITTPSLTDWTVGLAGYSQTIATSGGSSPLNFTVTGTLPAGLSLTSTGVLAGTPTAVGGYAFTVTVSDAIGARASQDFTVSVNPPVAIASTTLVSLTAGMATSQTLAASGGTGSLTWSESGALPVGVTLSSAGVLTGAAAAAGTYPITVTATDRVGARASQAYTVIVTPGDFGGYLVTVPGSVQAGSAFLVAVQAADSSGNPLASYTGPSLVTVNIDPETGTVAGEFSTSGSINSSGLGLVLASLQTAGSYTITVAGGSFTGSATVMVTPGPAAGLAFLVQPQNTPTGVSLSPVSVQVQDLYGNPITSDNSDSITLAVASGPGTFTAGSSPTAVVHNGVATFANLTLAVPGSYVLGARVASLYTGPFSSPFTIAPLQVVPSSFAGTPSGFSLQFNAPFLVNSVTPVLYGHGFGALGTAPSVIVTTDPGHLSDTAAYVAGSLVLDQADNRITFVTTTTSELTSSKLAGGPISPLLPDGVYTVILHSSAASDGFQALDSGGGFLDGLRAGAAGSGDFVGTFTVNTAAAHEDIVWLPATADGPGQPLSAPGKNQAGGGYPIYLSDRTAAVTSVQLTLHYNPALLTVTGTSGTGFSLLASSTPGVALLQYSGPALPVGTATPIGYLLATVPAGTPADPVPYKQKDLLHVSDVVLNGGTISPVATGDAVHLVAYVGDADGNGSYSNNDAVLITRTLLSTDTGFAAYPLVDPVIVADTDGSGFLPADAALQANEAGVGLVTANLPVPPVPPGVVFQAIGNNVGPALSVGRETRGVGRNGQLIRAANGGSLVTIAFHPRQGEPGALAPGGASASISPVADAPGSPVALVASVNPSGSQEVMTELEDAQGPFNLSTSPTNVCVDSDVLDQCFAQALGEKIQPAMEEQLIPVEAFISVFRKPLFRPPSS